MVTGREMVVVTSEGSKWNAAAMKSFAPSTIDSWYSKNQWLGPPRAAAHLVLSNYWKRTRFSGGWARRVNRKNSLAVTRNSYEAGLAMPRDEAGWPTEKVP